MATCSKTNGNVVNRMPIALCLHHSGRESLEQGGKPVCVTLKHTDEIAKVTKPSSVWGQPSDRSNSQPSKHTTMISNLSTLPSQAHSGTVSNVHSPTINGLFCQSIHQQRKGNQRIKTIDPAASLVHEQLTRTNLENRNLSQMQNANQIE